MGDQNDTLENLQQHLTDRIVNPFTYKYLICKDFILVIKVLLLFRNLNDVLHQQRMRNRSLKAREEKYESDMKKRNQKILQTVTQHFPDIDIMSKKEKHKQAIEQLAKPKNI
jgi:hypothetical protein